MRPPSQSTAPLLDSAKFRDPDRTARGERRAAVEWGRLDTLWFNTGTICNIECRNCYIESSPRNDRFAYLRLDETVRFLDEIAALDLGTPEIGFTGGEPFMNAELPAMIEAALRRGHRVLVLTNAMQPMMRPAVHSRLLQIRAAHADDLTLRVSIDHHTRELHEVERGAGSFEIALRGARWLADNGFRLAIAGRTCWGEDEAAARAGYDRLFATAGLSVDASDPEALVLFPEMDAVVDVPEITVDCWRILGVHPGDMMCASSRMVVRRKGADEPVVLACTLLPYDPQFELGNRLQDSFGAVKLNHPHCAKFCVLGGGSCSTVA